MSPYDDRYIDVKFLGEVSGSVTVAVEEGLPSPLCPLCCIETPNHFQYVYFDIHLTFYGFCTDFQQWRLACLALGFVLLLLAPIVSNWVPFYYSSSMLIGIFLVIIIILFQVFDYLIFFSIGTLGMLAIYDLFSSIFWDGVRLHTLVVSELLFFIRKSNGKKLLCCYWKWSFIDWDKEGFKKFCKWQVNYSMLDLHKKEKSIYNFDKFSMILCFEILLV